MSKPPAAPTGLPVWRQIKRFATGGDATFLWPRWFVLRAIGVVYIFIFLGILEEGRALIGPNGVNPLATYFAQLGKLFPGSFEAFLKAPSFFWLNASPAMIATLTWGGLLAAVALVLNLWPRVALFACWACFLSFVTMWGEFSPAQLDGLMLEAALLSIPFAPRGLRPGLGAASPPRPIALCMMRWLLFRVMFGSGLVKLVSDDPHWRDLTAMDVMYETAPSPTLLGYWVHHLPHAYHVFEVGFTFAAELLAPLLAIFGGHRSRWIALLLWTALQVGIQLTCNFGWLNTAAIGLGVLLLDDQMIAVAVSRLKLTAVGRWFTSRIAVPALTATPPAPGKIRLYGWRLALGAHFFVTLFYLADVCRVPVNELPAVVSAPAKFFDEFRSANGYKLYAHFETGHYQVDFEGSNDAGKTWRSYTYRHLPQRVDRITPFYAPRFARFETTVQLASSRPPIASVVPLVAAHLLAQTPEIVNRFESDPFPDQPPTVVRMRRYRLRFTDLATHRLTGDFWRKEVAGDYLPAMYFSAKSGIAQFDLTAADAMANNGNHAAAFALYEEQFRLGNLDAAYRLADCYSRGVGVSPQPEKVFALFSDLVSRGELQALHNLALCYAYGIGVPVDYAKAADLLRQAAARGNVLSMYALGALSAADRLVPRDDVEGLSLLLKAAALATGEDQQSQLIRTEEPAQEKLLMARMSPADIAKARLRASATR